MCAESSRSQRVGASSDGEKQDVRPEREDSAGAYGFVGHCVDPVMRTPTGSLSFSLKYLVYLELAVL